MLHITVMFTVTSLLQHVGLEMAFNSKNHMHTKLKPYFLFLFSTPSCTVVMFILQYGCEIKSQFTCFRKTVNVNNSISNHSLVQSSCREGCIQ